MKKVLFILIIILSFSLLACKTQEEEIETKEYTLNYSATPGGYLVGGTSQVVKGGESGEWVKRLVITAMNSRSGATVIRIVKDKTSMLKRILMSMRYLIKSYLSTH